MIQLPEALNAGRWKRAATESDCLFTSRLTTTWLATCCCKIHSPTSFPIWSYKRTLVLLPSGFGPHLRSNEMERAPESASEKGPVNQSIDESYTHFSHCRKLSGRIPSLVANAWGLWPESQKPFKIRFLSSSVNFLRTSRSILTQK